MYNDLKSAFDHYFEMVHADTDALREEVFRLRYQVYVLETGFERAEDHPEGLERDAFDARADHYLLRHRRTGLYAATARMILPDSENPSSRMPMELYCPLHPGGGIEDPQARRRLGEVSRFAVSKAFKRRLGETGSITGVSEQGVIAFDADERRVLPHLSLGLMAVELRSMHNHGLIYCYAVMESALHRLISRFGLIFHPIGPLVDYHGQRLPCLGRVHEFLPNIRRVAPSLWELITDGGRYHCGTL